MQYNRAHTHTHTHKLSFTLCLISASELKLHSMISSAFKLFNKYNFSLIKTTWYSSILSFFFSPLKLQERSELLHNYYL